MSHTVLKKREILPTLHNAIIALTALGADAANLEVNDNDSASKRLKRDLIDFKNGPLEDLFQKIKSVRDEIVAMPPTRTRVGNIQENLKRKKENSNFKP